MWDAGWFVYPQIMDRSDNMGERYLACDNRNYEKQTKLSLVHNWMHKAASWRPSTRIIMFDPKSTLGFYV
jgi:hypothetical protein